MVWRRLRSGLAIGALAAIATVALLSGALPLPESARLGVRGAARRAELNANDLLLAAAGPGETSGDEVVLAVVNQADLDAVAEATGEGWPWPREFWAVLTRFLTDAGASVIAFDIYFSEPSRYREDDRALGEALAGSGKTVLAVATSSVAPAAPPGSSAAISPTGTSATNPPAAANATTVTAAQVPIAGDLGALPRRARLVPPTADVAQGATALAIGEVEPDADALVRRVSPGAIVGGAPVATFAARIAMLHRRVDALAIEDGALRFGDRRLPLARDGSLTLRFRRPDPPRTPAEISFPSLHVADLLRAAFEHADGKPVSAEDERRLRGKIVIVGVNAPGVEDVEITPVSGTLPGIELHATAVDDFLRADFLDEWPRPGPYEHLPAVAMAVVVALVAFAPQSAVLAALASIAVYAAYAGAAALAYRAGVVLPLFGPLVGAVAAFGSSTLWLFVTEGRQKREIGRMFSQYVSPAVVEELKRHPEKLRLGGERRVMTALFSDIEGFSTVSEAMQPEDLVAFLNDYLTRCTDLVLDTGGVIDKYEGDAIIAFWNAPLDVPDHATRACEAAVRCQEACAAFRTESEARGLPSIRVRIGLNTGPMVVGNMGSNKRFDFTIMGDAVNLASRLEGANKVFGTYTMVSDATRTACGDGFAFRELGRLRVKGKNVPVIAHELLGRGAPPAWAATFEAALGAYYAGRFDDASQLFEAVLAILPDDPPAHRYLAHIAAIGQSPPASDFDGVMTLTEK